MHEDLESLRRFVQENSQAAFAELVGRRIDLVYSVALRQVGGDRQLAEDVTQKVFADLARKASRLIHHSSVAGWLYRSAQFAASDLVRSERRRKSRETQLVAAQDPWETPDAPIDWDRVRPLLDQELANLGEDDRNVLALRFFEEQSFREIGASLRLSEEAARKRLNRALEKMQLALSRRGVTSVASTLAVALGGQAGFAAPAGLASAVVAASMPGAGAFFVSTLFMATKSQILTGAVVLLAIGFGVVEAVRLQKLRSEHQTMAQRFDVLQSGYNRLNARAKFPLQALSQVTGLGDGTDSEGKPAVAGVTTPAAPAGPKPISFQLRDYPELQLLNRKKELIAAHLQFDRWYTLMNFSPPQIEAFEQKWGDRALALKDLEDEARLHGLDQGSASYHAMVLKLDEPIQEMLGSSGYQTLQEFRKTQWQRATVDSLATALYYTANPLDPATSVKLTETLAENSPPGKILASGDPARPAVQWDKVLTAAAAYLEPAQFQRLQAIVNQEKAGEETTRYIRKVVHEIASQRQQLGKLPAGPNP